MAETFELLLKTILDQAEATQARIETLSRGTLEKSDFDKFQIRLSKQFDDFQISIQTVKSDMSALDRKFNETQIEVKKTKEFVNSFTSAGKWFLRVTFVAILGVLTSIVPPFLSSLNKQPAPISVMTPYPVLTPAPTRTH